MSDEPVLERLAAAVLEGTEVDWDGEKSSAPHSDQAAIEQLRVLARLADLARADARDTLPPAGSADHPASWGHLILLQRVGRGSSSEVYRAWDMRLEREVALKLLPSAPHGRASASPLEEVRLLARVRHPNVVIVHGADEIGGQVGLWTEFLTGRTLETVLQQEGPFRVDRAVRVGIEVCRALSAVHKAGLLHRDIKAQNVMREDSGRVVLTDFGLASDCGLGDGDEVKGGTPLYMAPELFEQGRATIASDLYAVGVLLYRLVTGAYPVEARTLIELRNAHASGRMSVLRDVRPDVPGRFAAVVQRALARDPRARGGTAEALERSLASSVRGRAAWRQPLWRVVGAATAAAVTSYLFLLPSSRAVDGTAGSPARSASRAETAAPPRAELRPDDVAIAAPRPSPAGTPMPPMAAPASHIQVPIDPHGLVLVGAFTNETRDHTLDGAIEAAVARELSLSPSIRVASAERVQDALRLMKEPSDQTLTEPVARGVCRRDNAITALITGRLSSRENQFVLEGRIVQARSGTTLASITQRAASASDLVAAIRNLAFAIRDRLGERRETNRARQQQPEPTIRPSVGAARFYAESIRAAANDQWDVATVLARSAVSEEPSFASAHAWNGYVLLTLGQRQAATEAVERAAALSGTLTPAERLFVDALRADIARHREEATAGYEAYLRVRPDDGWAIRRLVVCYESAGRLEDLVRASMRAAKLRPNDYNANVAAAWYGMVLTGRLIEIQPFLAKARALLSTNTRPDLVVWLHFEPVFEDWLRGDARKAAARLDEAAREENGDEAHLYTLASLNVALGRLRAAEAALDRLPGDRTQHYWFSRAEIEWARGDLADGQAAIHALLRLPPDPVIGVNRLPALMVRMQMVGECEQLNASQPDRVRQGNLAFPPAEGEAALARNDLDRAVDRLSGWDALARGIPARIVAATSYAEALERRGDPAQAARVLESLGNERTQLYQRPTSAIVWWLRSREILERVYRGLRRTHDADVVASELRRLTAAADSDFLIGKPRR